MGRKKTVPQQMGQEKRQQIQWNMMDSAADQSVSNPASAPGSLIIISDDDPTLQQELQMEQIQAKGKALSGIVHSQGTAQSSSQIQNGYGISRTEREIDVPENTRKYFRRQKIRDQIKLTLQLGSCVPVYHKDHNLSKEVQSEWHWEMGKFVVQFEDHEGLPVDFQLLSHFQPQWLYFVHEDDQRPIICYHVYDEEVEKESKMKIEKARKSAGGSLPAFRKKEMFVDQLPLYWYIRVPFPDAFRLFLKFGRSSQKKFQFVFGEFDNEKKQVEVTLYGRQTSLQKDLAHPSHSFVFRDINYMMFELMGYFHNIGPRDRGYFADIRNQLLHQDLHELFQEVRSLQRLQKVSVNIDVQHPNLKPKLRPYQQDAVRWMLQQERYDGCDGRGSTDAAEQDDLHPLYTEVRTGCGKTLYYNRDGGSLLNERPKKVMSPPGGILADEMGLGKTVEVLCCMLMHPRPSVPLPSRLPTLTETEMEISESSSLSSVPSEFVTFEQTEDHSYSTNTLGDDGDNGSAECISQTVPAAAEDVSLGTTVAAGIAEEVAAALAAGDSSSLDASSQSEDVMSQATPQFTPQSKTESTASASAAGDSSASAATSQPEGSSSQSTPQSKKNSKSSQKRSLKRKSSDQSTESSVEPEANSESTLKPKKQLSASKKGRKKSQASARRKSEPSPTTRRGRKPSKPTEDGNSPEPQAKSEKRNRSRLSRCFSYTVTEEEYKQYVTPSPVIIPQRQVFECACGKGEFEPVSRSSRAARKQKHVVTCVKCGTSQHAECMQYDLEDPFRGVYKCPHCHYQDEPVPSGATLIIAPFSICHQWTDEIKKHVREKSIKVFVYTGVSHQGYVQPQTLAHQDIVISSYETLRKELNYVDLPHTNSEQGRRLRNPKKFMARPTPLTAVDWWRICLDEAQMVECVTTKTAEMALRLTCVNRWCVTGTPINHNIHDVFGLLAFIGLDPYCVANWWKKSLLTPYLLGERDLMYQVLAKALWRNTIKDVRNQLGLPGQTEQQYRLTFSPVEEVFYKRLYGKCERELERVTARWTEEEKLMELSSYNQSTVSSLLRPLLKLRQACCHPQIVKNSVIAVQEKVMTMDQLLTSLIKKTKKECREIHRGMIAAMNGQAGILLLQNPPRIAEAVALYRAVLMSVEEHDRKKQFETDKLPHLHTLYNLKQVLDTKPAGVAPTLRDDQLGKQCEELKQKYMEKASNDVTASKEQVAPFTQSVKDLTWELTSDRNWYVKVLSHAFQAGHEQDLVMKVQEDISHLSVTRSFRSTTGLQYIIEAELAELESARSNLLAEMKKIENLNTRNREILEEAITCCLRPVNGIELKTCVFCKLSDEFVSYETKIFDISLKEKQMAGEEIHGYRSGSWQDSCLELILKSVLSFARNYLLSRNLIASGSVHLRLFDALKKEFKPLRALWVKLKDEVSAVDELEMAVTRMRLRLPGEDRPGLWDVHIRERAELFSLLRQNDTEQKVNAADLRLKCGQLEYLKNLQKGSQGEFQNGVNPEPCPVCKDALGISWSVLHCGHCFCMNCIQYLMDKHSTGGTHLVPNISVKCPVCRERMKPEEISYVSTSRPENDFSVSVKGSHSTKIAAIVQCVFNIKKEDPSAKVLVFATWTEVLKLIGNALNENEIRYTHLYDHGAKFERNVTSFKTDQDITVLLLPYHAGSNGLNLFEASHVILAEPILSPAQEAQAIGRVYRMGQTKSTKIHRFIVRNTIEERIQFLMESTLRPAAALSEAVKDNSKLTVSQLISLFDDTDESSITSGNIAGPHGMPLSNNAGWRNALSDAIAGPSNMPSSSSTTAGPSGIFSNSIAGSREISSGNVAGPSNESSGSTARPSSSSSSNAAVHSRPLVNIAKPSGSNTGSRDVLSKGAAGPMNISSGITGQSRASSPNVAGSGEVSSDTVAGPSSISSTDLTGPSRFSSSNVAKSFNMYSGNDAGPSNISSDSVTVPAEITSSNNVRFEDTPAGEVTESNNETSSSNDARPDDMTAGMITESNDEINVFKT